jgi:hypothetical protein
MQTSGIEQNESSSAAMSEKHSIGCSDGTNEPMPSMISQELAKTRAKKTSAIRKACAAQDVEALAMYATSEGGLLEDELRQIACRLSHVLGKWIRLTGT